MKRRGYSCSWICLFFSVPRRCNSAETKSWSKNSFSERRVSVNHRSGAQKGSCTVLLRQQSDDLAAPWACTTRNWTDFWSTMLLSKPRAVWHWRRQNKRFVYQMIVHGHVQNTCDRNNAMFMRVFKLYRVTVHSNKPTVLKTETSSMFRSGREKQIGGTYAICGQKKRCGSNCKWNAWNLFKQQLMKQTSSLGWPSWSNYFFSFFLAPVAKKSLKNINVYVVVYKANGRLANPYCFWSPTSKKKTNPTPEAANQWSGRPGGCTLAGQLAKFRAQLQENGLARIAKSGTKQNYLTDVLHPPPLFVFPSVPKMACGAACVDGWDRKGEKWDEMRWN